MCWCKKKESSQKTPDVAPGNINSYIENRLNSQIKWYSQKSHEEQIAYRRIQVIELILTALIPLLSGYTVEHPRIAFAVGVIGAIITVLEGTERLFRHHENWIRYRSTCEMLKHEKNLYLMNSSPYGTDSTKEQLLVHNVETLLSAETSKWTSSHEKIIQEQNRSHSETGV